MGTTVISFFHMLALLLSSDSTARLTENRKVSFHESKRLQEDSASISTMQKDITTPITTIPTANPSTTNPRPNPTFSPTNINPANPLPLATNTPGSSSGGSWCIASPSASESALQLGLDFACSYGADCAAIQLGATCYNPNTLRDHASFAFNSYYQQNPIPTSCNFGGAAIATSTDPSLDTCVYPSTSTTSSLLNITNSSGSRVFGAGRPITPETSPASSRPSPTPYFNYILVPLMILLYGCSLHTYMYMEIK